MQAPFLPLRTVSARADMSVAQLFQAFVDASGSTHLVAGRRAVPPTTRVNLSAIERVEPRKERERARRKSSLRSEGFIVRS